ncbi:WhiB family transcriptional regulator [uncultured Jatrophihabitans sp.]|uniref:WhiB family transcriptional regulator n=1 Tax=uncultured Jatrophihabitans sp. TaxID=1610747 RepID=UPI0035CA804D
MTPQWRDWPERAACNGLDTDIFFPVGRGAHAARLAERARVICRQCPVAQRCADVAIEQGLPGIWGGLDEQERRALRRGRSTTGQRVATG